MTQSLSYCEWICIFGIAFRITTDCGRQFESHLFQSLAKVIFPGLCSSNKKISKPVLPNYCMVKVFAYLVNFYHLQELYRCYICRSIEIPHVFNSPSSNQPTHWAHFLCTIPFFIQPCLFMTGFQSSIFQPFYI